MANKTRTRSKRPVKVGTRVYIGGLKVEAEVRQILDGATVRYVCRWWNDARQAYRETRFFREDFTVIRQQKAAAA